MDAAHSVAVQPEARRDHLSLERVEVVEQVRCRYSKAEEVVVELCCGVGSVDVDIGIGPAVFGWSDEGPHDLLIAPAARRVKKLDVTIC